ncbi:MFS transporter, partial [Escherichia coli O119]|nr:MFS transporter [Escherichia coli O119]
MRQQVLILAGSQAIFQSISVLIMTIGGLAGALLTPNPSLVTVPISMASLGTVLVMFPASLWMDRAGRKTGFITGTLSGIMAAVISMVAMIQDSFILLCLGMFFLGIYQAFAQFFRFAAGEVALPAFRTRAISLVLAGGVVAALLGPFLASYGSTLFSVTYMGSFLFMAVLASLGLLLLSRLHMPTQTADPSAQTGPRPWFRVISQPSYLVALFSGASGFGIMVLGLTATPIAMKHYGFELPQIAVVTAFIWMLFNIFLSIWFFVTSLNVLDDDKRDRLMKKYYQSQMVSQYIQQSMIRSWLQYPGHYIGNQYLKTIKILPYADAMNDGMNTLTCPVKKNEVVKDIYLRPLLFLLRRLRPVPDQEAEIVILPSSGRENDNLTLLSAKGVITSQLWNWLYRRCIPMG